MESNTKVSADRDGAKLSLDEALALDSEGKAAAKHKVEAVRAAAFDVLRNRLADYERQDLSVLLRATLDLPTRGMSLTKHSFALLEAAVDGCNPGLGPELAGLDLAAELIAESELLDAEKERARLRKLKREVASALGELGHPTDDPIFQDVRDIAVRHAAMLVVTGEGRKEAAEAAVQWAARRLRKADELVAPPDAAVRGAKGDVAQPCEELAPATEGTDEAEYRRAMREGEGL